MQKSFIKYAILFELIIAQWPCSAIASDKAWKIDTLGETIVVGVQQSVIVQGKVRWKKTGKNSIEVEVPRHHLVERVEDVGRDGVIELWVIEGNPDNLYLDLYQIDTRNIRSEKTGLFHGVKMSLSALASADAPFQFAQLQDVDGDGVIELVIKTPTLTQGTPYQAGKLEWEDIYNLEPWPRLANTRYKSFFKKKREDITREIMRVKQYALESEKRASLEKDDSYRIIEFLHAAEAQEQIKAYEEWLKRIDAILQE